MLKIYRRLFLKLADEDIRYFIYKGLNHIEEDLSGERGDLDIIVFTDHLDKFDSIVKEIGFNRVKTSSSYPIYYMTRDEESGAFVMIDIDIKMRLGHKPNKSISFIPSFEELTFERLVVDNVSIVLLGKPDYFPLILLTRITEKTPTAAHLKELKLLYKEVNIEVVKDSSIGSLVNKINSEILIVEDKSWENMQRLYKNQIVAYFSRDTQKFKTNSIKLYSGIKEIFRKAKRVIGSPAALAHKGYMVAFVGVDGAGKSSAIDCVLNDKYFQATGLKRIYFGGNEFMIPGILTLYQWLVDKPAISGLRVIPSMVMQFDRRLRLLKALYFRAMGNIVLCDRYYYDDELSRETVKDKIAKGKGSSFLNKLQLFSMPRVLVKPDMTFYLDVSPEVAYQRKQDFSYEVMLKVNKNYRNFMQKRKEVTFINANEEQVKVQYKILKYIKDLSDQRSENDT